MQKHGGGNGKGGIKGCDHEGGQGVECGCGCDVDEREEQADDGGETDAV